MINMLHCEYIRFKDLIKQGKIVSVSPKYKLKNEEISDDGCTAVVSQDKEFIIGYTNLVDEKLVNPPYFIFGDHTEITKYIDFSFVQGADGLKIYKGNGVDITTEYLYYAINSCYNKTGFYERHSKYLARTLIPILSLKLQQKFVDYIKTYDDLIENNERQIQILEEMAEKLYKEWFVHFRFSGYENVDFYEGIPTIWKYEKIGDIMTFDRGISYSSEEIDCDEGLNLINLKNIQSFGGFRRDGTKKYNGKYKTSQVVKENDLIMGVTDMTQERRTVGSVALIPDMKGISVISADLVKVNSDIDNVFLYTMFRFGNISKYLSQFGNGANVIHLKPDTIKNKKILVPDSDTIKAFTDIIKPIIAQLNNLNNQNDNLTEQRDLLLPRLMSGKLELK